MRIQEIKRLSEDNSFSNRPVLVVYLDPEHLGYLKSSDLPVFNFKLLSAFPELRDHKCNRSSRPGFFLKSLYTGTSFGHVLDHLVRHLCLRYNLPAKINICASNGGYPLAAVVDADFEEPMLGVLEMAISFLNAFAHWKPSPRYQSKFEKAMTGSSLSS